MTSAPIQNCGRAVIQARPADFQDRFGITSDKVSPASTSQTGSCRGYVHKRNRPSESAFRCPWCGLHLHADVNAARNTGPHRAPSIGSVFQSKASILAERVRRFTERRVLSPRSGERGSTTDRRWHNSYFGAETPTRPRCQVRLKRQIGHSLN